MPRPAVELRKDALLRPRIVETRDHDSLHDDQELAHGQRDVARAKALVVERLQVALRRRGTCGALLEDHPQLPGAPPSRPRQVAAAPVESWQRGHTAS